MKRLILLLLALATAQAYAYSQADFEMVSEGVFHASFESDSSAFVGGAEYVDFNGLPEGDYRLFFSFEGEFFKPLRFDLLGQRISFEDDDEGIHASTVFNAHVPGSFSLLVKGMGKAGPTSYFGSIWAQTLSPVPEPSTTATLVLGLAAACFAGKWRRTSASRAAGETTARS
jgi:hypothetical protein